MLKILHDAGRVDTLLFLMADELIRVGQLRAQRNALMIQARLNAGTGSRRGSYEVRIARLNNRRAVQHARKAGQHLAALKAAGVVVKDMDAAFR